MTVKLAALPIPGLFVTDWLNPLMPLSPCKLPHIVCGFCTPGRMKFNLICDESSINERHLVVGALTLPRINHALLSAELNALKAELGLRKEGELKWAKVSRAYLPKYEALCQWFFSHLRANNLTFRAHVVDTSARAYRLYGRGDLEHSFYKVYFHVLFQSICRLALDDSGSNVLVLLDQKRNRYPFHLDVIKRGLNIRLTSKLGVKNLVGNVEPRASSGPKSEPLIQIVDILIGAIAYVRNKHGQNGNSSPARAFLIDALQEMAGTQFVFDTTARAPFNIWTFDAAVAMERKKLHKIRSRSGF